MAPTPELPDARSAIGASPAYLAALVAETGCPILELAARLGVSPRQFHRWLSGDSRAPYAAVYALERLALAAGNPEPDTRAAFIRDDYLPA